MSPKMGRLRLPSFWNLVFVFTLGASLVAMATLVLSPGRVLAQQALPISIQSPMLANYSADEVTYLLPPVQLRLAEEAVQDKLARFERIPERPQENRPAEVLKSPPAPTLPSPTLPVAQPTKTEPASTATRIPTRPVVVVLKPSATRTPPPTNTSVPPSQTPVPPVNTATQVVKPSSTFTQPPAVIPPTKTSTKRPTLALFPTRTRTPTRTLIALPTKTFTAQPTKTPLPTKTPTKTKVSTKKVNADEWLAALIFP